MGRLAQQHGEEDGQQFLADLERLQDIAQEMPAPDMCWSRTQHTCLEFITTHSQLTMRGVGM